MSNAQANFNQVPDVRDRREHPRSASFWLTYVELGQDNGGIVLNISESGLAVTAAEPLAEEFYPRLRFRLPKSEQWIETNAHVVWTDTAKKGAGVRFIDLDPGDRERIRNWVSAAGKFVDIHERRSLAEQAEHQLAEMSRKRWLKRTPVAQPVATVQNFAPATPEEETAEPAVEPLLQPEKRRRVEISATPPTPAQASKPEAKRRNGVLVLAGVVVLGLIFFAVGVGLGKGLFDKWLSRYAKAEPAGDNSSAASATNSLPAGDSGGAISTSKNVAPAKRAQVAPATNSPTQRPPILMPAGQTGESAATNQALEPVLVAPPSEAQPPSPLLIPEQAVSASSSLAISFQLSVLVPAQPGSKNLQAGALLYHVDPVFSLPPGQQQSDGTVKLRANIGKDGVVNDVKAVSGPAELLEPSVNAVRQWRYGITRLQGQPIEATADITIEYRPGR
jgi:PilZ domain-containing protein/TonB-like protein